MSVWVFTQSDDISFDRFHGWKVVECINLSMPLRPAKAQCQFFNLMSMVYKCWISWHRTQQCHITNTYLPKQLEAQCYIQWVYKAPLCITLRIKTWVAAYFDPPKKIKKKKSKTIFYKSSFMQLFSADATIFLKEF